MSATPTRRHARDLEGQTAIVTGAGSGIGRATAELFGEHGAQLVLVGRNVAHLRETAAAVKRSGAASVIAPGDVTVAATAQQALEAGIRTFGGIDVLVNNAGMALMKTVVDTSLDEWHRVIDTNLTSIFLFSRLAVPAMRDRGGGVIVNVASEAGIVGFRNYAAYSASKAAVVNLSRAMALDHASDGIRVNCVCPGSIETPLLEAYYRASDDPVAARRQDEADHPLGIGDPIDVAYGILFLASMRARYVTGQALVIDGGYTAG